MVMDLCIQEIDLPDSGSSRSVGASSSRASYLLHAFMKAAKIIRWWGFGYERQGFMHLGWEKRWEFASMKNLKCDIIQGMMQRLMNGFLVSASGGLAYWFW